MLPPFVRAFGIVLAVSFLGEMLNRLIPLPIPAGVYGLVLLLLALMTGLVKPRQVKPASDFLIKIMPLLFVPALAGLPQVWPLLEPVLLPVALITLATLFMVLAASGWAVQGVMGRERRRPHE